MNIKQIIYTGCLILALPGMGIAQIGSSILVDVQPLGIVSENSTKSHIQYAGSSILYTQSASCNVIALVNTSNDLGTVTSEVTIGPPSTFNGEPYVGRHYDIKGSTNTELPVSVTIYFTPEEFTAYNVHASAISTALFPAITPSGDNLRITAFHGNPEDGTTGPNGEYDFDNKEYIIPTVFFNADNGYYEVSFISNGLSGFFAHTGNAGTPLNVDFTTLTADWDAKNTARVNWAIASQEDVDMILEKSANGIDFYPIYQVSNNASNQFEYLDADLDNWTTVLYRVNATYSNGRNVYSSIVSLSQQAEWNVSLFPNPCNDALNIQVSDRLLQYTIEIFDHLGRPVKRIENLDAAIYTISTADLASGLYFLSLDNGVRKKVLRFSKED